MPSAFLDRKVEVAFGWDPSSPETSLTASRSARLELHEGSAPLRKRAERVNRSFGKRAVDVVCAGLGLAFLAPLLLLVALLIKLDSKGPVFFRQQRYGMGRKPFMIFKFRSMSCMEATGAFRQATSDDTRVTRVGRLLRRTSIDEIPQLINVLMGDMSLVGPRPHALAMDDVYAEMIDGYVDRHLVRPGLTGLAQIGGYRGPTADVEMINGRLRLDRAYIHSWSVLGDIVIMARTPFRLFDRGAF